MNKNVASLDVKYKLDESGCFNIENYNQSKPFSNFFPGVAGIWGIPMWVFYVNRGQCISSFGIESKDRAIVEFVPANKAYRQTSINGFRTFIKIAAGNKTIFWEPFQNVLSQQAFKTSHQLSMTSHDLTIEEVNHTLGLTIKVNYFTIANEDFPALVRRVWITNHSKKSYSLEIADGLPVILPYGMKDWLSKNMSRTVEAWVKVKNIKAKAPFYQLNVEVADTSTVTHINEGNFYFAFERSADKAKLLDAVVDAAALFGPSSDFLNPQNFLAQKNFKVPADQQTSNRTPCAFSFNKMLLGANKTKEFVAVCGYAHDANHHAAIIKRAMGPGYIEKKSAENAEVIARIKNYALTSSSSHTFDLYSTQTFLDNVLRGGLPVSLGTEGGKTVFNVFSRKHGDLERDYNYFVLSPTYYSQGNGNFRDVNQNRRNDVWFNPDVQDSSIVNFLSLVQADGYNPLIVKGLSFTVADPSKAEAVVNRSVNGENAELKEYLKKSFQPGELLRFIRQKNIRLKISLSDFLGCILSVCNKTEQAEHGEGFWADHWTYNLDLIESYLSVYPERLRTLLLEKKEFSFYHNSHYVLSRDHRYLLTEHGVRQYHSVYNGHKEIKAEEKGSKLRTGNGNGEVYYTTLLVKLLCLVANKAATLDPSGIGVEMEADKPSWYDALNGLPGLLGSSVPESLELKRYAQFILQTLKEIDAGATVKIFDELAIFLNEVKSLLEYESDPLAYWQKSNDVKEQYRSRVLYGIEGDEKDVPLDLIVKFLELVIQRVDWGLELAKDSNGVVATYLKHEVTKYDVLNKKRGEYSYVRPLNFKRHFLPLFLEGPVHNLRVEKDPENARALYQAVRKSALFDKKLKMYKVNADLSKESEDIGRTRVFPRGWLENESIWLHMEYKYMLEFLRCGLYEEFFTAMKEAMVPFLKAEKYGRSTLENSSFIASSAHEDDALHGQGFVARLSGSTAEFLHMWLLMNVGQKPFGLDVNGKLTLTLKPALPGWLFSTSESVVEYWRKDTKSRITLPKNTYAFNILGSTLVVYHNPQRKNTFGKKAAEIKGTHVSYAGRAKNPTIVYGPLIPSPLAKDIREGKVERLDVFWE